MKLEKDKIPHIITCFTLTIIFFCILRFAPFELVLTLFSSLMAFSFFTTFKETINDLIYKNGCFDIGDIKANAIGSILGGIVLCILSLLF